MSKQVKTKYSETDLKRMRREIKNFNARRAYQIKKHPETAEFQPEKLTLKNVLKTVSGKSDLKQWEKSVKAYTSKTAETKTNKYGVSATKWQIAETRKAVAKENRRLKKEAEREKAVFVNGKKIETAAKAASKFDKSPIKRGFKEAKTAKEWKEFQKAFRFIGSKKKSEAEKDNLWYKIKTTFEKQGFNDELWLLYETLGAAELWKLYENGFDCVDIEFLYDENIDPETKENKIFDELTTKIQEHGKIETALKKLKKYFNIKDNGEAGKLWKKIPPADLWELYTNGGQINNPDELYRLIDRIQEETEE